MLNIKKFACTRRGAPAPPGDVSGHMTATRKRAQREDERVAGHQAEGGRIKCIMRGRERVCAGGVSLWVGPLELSVLCFRSE